MGEWLQMGDGAGRAYLAAPERGSGPGVLVLHAWWGLNPVITGVCDRLATEGFVALAPDMYLDGATADTIAGAEQLAERHQAQTAKAEALALSAVDYLRKTSGPIGAVGFSLGAYWALKLSQVLPDDITAVVPVYGTGETDFSRARAAYQGHFAEADDFEPAENVAAYEQLIRDAGLEVTFYSYPGTGHWFFEPDRPEAYNPEAAALVWERMLEFFTRKLG